MKSGNSFLAKSLRSMIPGAAGQLDFSSQRSPATWWAAAATRRAAGARVAFRVAFCGLNTSNCWMLNSSKVPHGDTSWMPSIPSPPKSAGQLSGSQWHGCLRSIGKIWSPRVFSDHKQQDGTWMVLVGKSLSWDHLGLNIWVNPIINHL